MKIIDINCDVGEGIGNEEDLFPIISSCNIACGGHAGDVGTMASIVQLAKEHRVKIGAHPSYPDRENFGRVSIPMATMELQKSIGHQMDTFMEVLRTCHGNLHHIKPHGALYNDVAKDEVLAQCLLNAIQPYKDASFLYVPYNSVIAKLAGEQGFKIKWEAFGDRNYNEDLSLVSRMYPNAMIEEPEAVMNHISFMVRESHVMTVTNEKVKILADTFCIHGDTASALEILMYLSERLPLQNIAIYK